MSKLIDPKFLGPMKIKLKAAKIMVECLNSDDKHWFCGGQRSVAIAVNLLKKHEVIAVPTDTIYGLAGAANSTIAIENLYRIKQREKNKPLAICLSNVNDIPTYGVVDHLPPKLLQNIFPGRVTVILKRTKAVNPYLNPEVDSIGIRIPQTDFLTTVAKIVGPLALTSANISNQPNTIAPEEFSDIWPVLGGIFHCPKVGGISEDAKRMGSTIVDLTIPGQFKIKREGLGYVFLKSFLLGNGLYQSYD